MENSNQLTGFCILRIFTKWYSRIDFNTLPAENKNFLPSKGHLPFPLQLIIPQEQQQ